MSHYATHLGIMQVTIADLIATLTPPKTVTCVQYARHLFVYDEGDSRIEERTEWCHNDIKLQESAMGMLPTLSQRMQRMLQVSQLKVEVVPGVSLSYLKSEAVMLELMDSLTFVHDFTDGKDCC